MEKHQDLGKEIWLRSEELERMIQGSLQWTDVAARLDHQPEKNRIESNKTTLKKLEGLKVVFFLVGVAILTMVTWVYFVFYR